MIDKNMRALIKEQIGISDEDLDKVSPGYSKLISVLSPHAVGSRHILGFGLPVFLKKYLSMM